MSLKDLLAGSGSNTSATFERVGDTIGGRVVSADHRQVHGFESGKPEFWDDGSPKLQAVVVVNTTLRDPAIENDNGDRAIYVKWWGNSRKAFLEAVKVSGDDDVRPGGTFHCTYTGEVPSERKGFNATKLFTYQYTQPGTGLTGAPAATVASPPATPGVDPNYAAYQAAQAAAATTPPPAAVTPPPVAVTPPPPAAASPAVVTPPPPVAAGPSEAERAAATALFANLKAHMAAGWTDDQLVTLPQFAHLQAAQLAAVRNSL